ncbi:phage terminase large subunit [Sphingomonas caeni]|uniref:phage terminase large subunit n=1 Tax=Sphingomonas caeni TaxID=2984949 RepID=UPI003872F2A3
MPPLAGFPGSQAERVAVGAIAASGFQLIQTFRAEQPQGVPLPIPRKPEGDKQSRMPGVSAQIEAGHLMLPTDAAWLAEFKAENLGFPNARHDDQADALTQLMSSRPSARHSHVQIVSVCTVRNSRAPSHRNCAQKLRHNWASGITAQSGEEWCAYRTRMCLLTRSEIRINILSIAERPPIEPPALKISCH